VIIIEFSLILWLCVIVVFRGYFMFWFVLYKRFSYLCSIKI